MAKENIQQSSPFLKLPHEIRVMIWEKFSPLPENIADKRLICSELNEEIISTHGPRLEKFNEYLSFFGGCVQKQAPTFKEYFEQLQIIKEPFLERQFAEIQKIKEWENNQQQLIPDLINAIQEIKGVATSLAEAKKREQLLNEINIKIINSKIENLMADTHLDLSSLGLTRLPNQLFMPEQWEKYWQNCTRLSLRGNHLHTIPYEITSLKNLQLLDLSENLLNHLPNEIQNLENLQVLKLNDNLLSLLPEGITLLKKLQDLNLSNNQLTELPEGLYNVESIVNLDITSNLIDDENKSRKSLKLLSRPW